MVIYIYSDYREYAVEFLSSLDGRNIQLYEGSNGELYSELFQSLKPRDSIKSLSTLSL